MKRDRQRARRQAALRGERVQHAHEEARAGAALPDTPEATTSTTPQVIAPTTPMADPCAECGGSGSDDEPGKYGEQVCKACNGTGERAPTITVAEPVSPADVAWGHRRTATSA